MKSASPVENHLAWGLAALTLLHAILLSPSDDLFYIVVLVLLAGAGGRHLGWLAPGWVAVPLALAAGVFAASWEGTLWPGAGGVVLAATTLLAPLSPRRTHLILFGLMVAMVGISPRLPALWSPTFAALDVAAALVIAQEIHRPPEARVTLWRSLIAALRLGLPVSAAVVLLFWLFPSVAPRDPWVGFSSGMLDPGRASALRRSSRPVFSARFAGQSPVPRASDLYWRCEILDINDGMRWSRSLARPTRNDSPLPAATSPVWEYEIFPVPHSALPLLDRPSTVSAIREGGAQPPDLLSGGVFRLDDLVDVRIVATSSPPAPEARAPGPQNLQAPRVDVRLETLVGKLVEAQNGTQAAMAAVRDYFADGGFVYSLHPGRQRSPRVSEFLFLHRRGFCEHYAAAAANIFRLGGIPARVVTGYRGGEWNPWLREITVRQSDAHAWVEVWDPQTSSWQRFDPTDAVTPDFSEMIENEMQPDNWPWHRKLARRAAAWADTSSQSASPWITPVGTVLILIALLAATWWVWRLSSRVSPQAAAARHLARLEARLARSPLERQPGETPLAWMERLGKPAADTHPLAPDLPALLRNGAAEYESAVYSNNPPARIRSLARLARRFPR